MYSEHFMEELVGLCKRRGFIFQGSEIYGGLAGTYDYGPLGSLLKNNIRDSWIKTFVHDRMDMYLVDAAILMNQRVWQATGHVDSFVDPMIDCENCKKRYRTDNLIKNEQEYFAFIAYLKKASIKTRKEVIDEIDESTALLDYQDANNTKSEEIYNEVEKRISKMKDNLDFAEKLSSGIKEAYEYLGFIPMVYLELENGQNQKCLSCGEKKWSTSRKFNMMLETKVGAAEDSSAVSYLRPETAQGIFVNYKNVVDSMSPKLPFGIAQVGKAFRNEITPRDFIFRLRELEQMEIEYFIHPNSNWENIFDTFLDGQKQWIVGSGVREEMLHQHEHPAEGRAFYSKKTVDWEFDFPFGQKELTGLAYRTDYDLGKHSEFSGQKLNYFDEENKEHVVPHVIEPSHGLDRMVLAVLSSTFSSETLDNGEVRNWFAFPYHIAPYKACVSPLLKNRPELVEKAQSVFALLKKEIGQVVYDESGNIGKRYRRQDEIGTPWCVVIDFETLGQESPDQLDTVTVRNRDTGQQVRVAIGELVQYIKG